MKKIIIFIILVILVIYSFLPFNFITKSKNEYRGIFVSYIELSKYVKNNNINICKKNIDTMIENIYSLNFNLIILQVRSFSDAIYYSKIFPWSKCITDNLNVSPGFDILDYFIKKCHDKNISLFAWINPYRISSNSDVNSIDKSNPAYDFIGTRNIIIDNGIYYNPSSTKVLELILNGIDEIISNYSVDGILFDDYFYPNVDCDYVEYMKYISIHDYIDFKNYHYMIINNMIKKVHDICSSKNILFGVSPDANVDNNYNYLFADVKTWLSNSNYVDFIMPQVYYGFFNESKAFKKVIDEWEGFIKNDDILFMVALAFYKVGKEDKYARNGRFEWINNNDIIMREILLSRNLKFYSGFSLFRYGFLFDENVFSTNTILEINNMKKIIN